MALESRIPEVSGPANTPVATGEPMMSNVSRVGWGGIIAGTLVTIALMFMFTLLGSAIGLSALKLEAGQTPSQGAAIGAGIYAFITLLISFYVGGYCATRLCQPRMKSNAAMHGLSTWALLASLFLFMIGSGLTAAMSGIFSFAGQTAQNLFQSSGGNVSAMANKIPQAPPGTTPNPADTQRIAGEVRQAVKSGTWVAFFSFLFGGAACIGGAVAGGGPYGLRATSTRAPLRDLKKVS